MNDDLLKALLDLPEAQTNGARARSQPDFATYIWISRWEDFQHYRPERDRAPAWIKNYTKQLDDDDYRGLSAHARGVLGDLRIAFPRSFGRLSRDTRQLSDRFGYRVTRVTLDALNHAGFIEYISRETLDQNLELLYSSPRARVEVEVEVEKEPPNPHRRGGSKPSKKKNHEELLERARELAARWTGGDSDAFDVQLDELEHRQKAKLSVLERDDLWDSVFRPAPVPDQIAIRLPSP